MQKIITLMCDKTEEKTNFKVGAGKDMATLSDIVALMPDSKERNKILEWILKTTNTKSPRKLITLYDNLAETLCNINYEALGAKVNLFDSAVVDKDETIKRFKTNEVTEKIAASKAKWVEALNKEGVIAFNALYYCRKCKQLTNGLYLRLHSIDGGKEFVYVYPNRCETCKCEIDLVNDGNMGFVYSGLPTVMTGKSGGTYIAEGVSFSIKQ